MKNLVVCLIVILFSACGGGGEDTGASSQTITPTTQDTSQAEITASTLAIKNNLDSLSTLEYKSFNDDWQLAFFDIARKGQVGGSIQLDTRNSIAYAHVRHFLEAATHSILQIKAIQKTNNTDIKNIMISQEEKDFLFYKSPCSGSGDFAKSCESSNKIMQSEIHTFYLAYMNLAGIK